jgi:hypothetical protein
MVVSTLLKQVLNQMCFRQEQIKNTSVPAQVLSYCAPLQPTEETQERTLDKESNSDKREVASMPKTNRNRWCQS